jgi:hypothetical protein
MNSSALRVALAYLMRTAGYYQLTSGTSLKEVVRRWAADGDKAYDDSMPVLYKTSDLLPYREYRWTREKSRPGYAKIKGKNVHLSGPLKWDALVEDMKLNGWDPKEPLHLHVGKDGKTKVAEGNHRLAVAAAIKLSKVPVWVHFHQRVQKSPPVEPPVEIAPRAVKKLIEAPPKAQKPRSPEEEQQLNDLMGLLGL